MKMKHIAAALAFSAAFFFSTLLSGFPKANYNWLHQCRLQNRPNVTSLLEQDVAFGENRDAHAFSLYQELGSAELTYSSKEYAQIVTEYVSQSESLDDSMLPHDFRLAWHAHMQAWRAHAGFLNDADKIFPGERVNKSAFFEFFNRNDQEITDTWRKVEFFGRKYGANNVRY